MEDILLSVTLLMSIPFGMYCLISLLVFSTAPQVIYRIVCPKTYGATQRQHPLSDILWHPNKSSESCSSSSASANPYVIPEILLDGDGLNCALFS